VLLQTGDKFPHHQLSEQPARTVLHRRHLVAAGSVVVALPPLIVFFVLQKQFVSGLTLGATKG
jgi:multiple sugar transport system permease protein